MKYKKVFLLAVIPGLMTSLLSGCSANNNYQGPLEIGDTVKEWKSHKDSDKSPLDVASSSDGQITISKAIGNNDKSSIECSITGKYIGSDALEDPYFIEDDAKNGDIISLCFYLPSDNNISSLQLEALTSSSLNPNPYGGNQGESIKADSITVDDEKLEKWIRTQLSYDTLETLGAIRFNVTRADAAKPAHFYIDNINITLGAETVKTGYEYNGESLCEAYEDYFKIGTCMSERTLRNTELRKILKNDFNSVTAENEGKPENILDQSACQKLLQNGEKDGVAIKISPFEKLFDYAEANHIAVRHHTFVWYSQTPSWFFTEDYNGGKQASRELMLSRMENFIRVTLEAINDNWPGLVYAIDVANEAIENGGLRTNNNNWYNTVGDDFVARALEYANKYKDPDQDLYYNDFAYDYNYSHCQYAINTLLKEPIEKGWIDGVGIQGHIDDDQNMDTVINDAKLIKQAGLKCQITELDLETRGSGDNIWKKQADAYSLLMKRVLESNDKEETDINAVIVWGITDNTSWKARNNPLLFNSDYAKKPSYYAMLNAVEEFENK